jgi:hypothetical protein
LIGSAGTGVGSRIKGHAKLGGKQLGKRHRRYTTVGITNEYHTSQTCSQCLSPIIHLIATKIIKGKTKMLTNQGTSLCLNIHCPPYKLGRNSCNRDISGRRVHRLGRSAYLSHWKESSSVYRQLESQQTFRAVHFKNTKPSTWFR